MYVSGIYRIISPCGKSYIGRSRNIFGRIKSHKTGRTGKKLKESFDLHGVDAHVFEVIEKCDE